MIKRPMINRRTIPVKADPEFHKFLKEVQRKRIINGLDAEAKSITRLTLAISRHEGLKNDLERAKLMDDTRAQLNYSVFNLFLIGIVALLAVVMLGGYIYLMGILSTTFNQIGISNEGNSGIPGYVNLTNAAAITFGQVNQGVQSLRLVALCLIMSEILGFIFISGLVKIHPAFFFVYMLIVVLAVIFAAPISNAYESLLQANVYGGLLNSFTGSNWLLLNLPMIIAITGIVGAIFMFINIISAGNQGVIK